MCACGGGEGGGHMYSHWHRRCRIPNPMCPSSSVGMHEVIISYVHCNEHDSVESYCPLCTHNQQWEEECMSPCVMGLTCVHGDSSCVMGFPCMHA